MATVMLLAVLLGLMPTLTVSQTATPNNATNSTSPPAPHGGPGGGSIPTPTAAPTAAPTPSPENYSKGPYAETVVGIVIIVGVLCGLGGLLVLYICFGGGTAFSFGSHVGEASMMDISLSKEEQPTPTLQAASNEPEVEREPEVEGME